MRRMMPRLRRYRDVWVSRRRRDRHVGVSRPRWDQDISATSPRGDWDETFKTTSRDVRSRRSSHHYKFNCI